MKIINIGCGMDIIKNVINIDYNRAFKYIKYPFVANIMSKMHLLNKWGYSFICDNQENKEYNNLSES